MLKSHNANLKSKKGGTGFAHSARMASSRPSRVSKTTAMLLNKVASGTLEEFLGETPLDEAAWGFPQEVEDDAAGYRVVQVEETVFKRDREEEEDDEEYGEVGNVRRPIVLDDEDEAQQEYTGPSLAIVKKPRKISKKIKKTRKTKERKEVVFSVPTRHLPLRKSMDRRALGTEIAMGDYVADSRLEELVDCLAAASHDREVRREGEDPDPNSRRVWDTECHVLGRGLAVARSRLPGAGFGLFATQDFAKGVLVTEYVGEELTKEQAFALRDAGKDQYVRSLKNGYCIDGNKYPALGESCAQMANDGRDAALNNCIFVATDNRDKLQEKPRVYLKTLQHIRAGEELLASYGKRYWEFHGRSNSSDSHSSGSDESSNVEAGE